MMNFEEMQKIWDAPSQQTLYAMNEVEMHKCVNRYQHKVLSMGHVVEVSLVGIALFVAVFYATEGVLNAQYYQLPGSVMFAGVALYILSTRRARRSIEGESDRSVLGDLELSIRSLEFQIRRQRHFIWWFMLPAFLLVVVQSVFGDELRSGLKLAVMAIAGAASLWLTRWELNAKLLPRLQKLKNLRNLLMTES